ncbi:MAG: HRDC domain-containing protein [Phycisphaerales bacterium]|nr:HRDC domain-containing protein [Phycisphaerales bacterium]
MSPTPKKKNVLAHTHRSRKRTRQHALSSSEANALVKPAKLPENDLIVTDPPVFIETQNKLDAFLKHIHECKCVAYDTEFVGELSYFPKLCLIQLVTTEQIAVVDAMADLDLSGVWEVLADPDIDVVVHAGQQDLEPVVRLGGKAPSNIFDVQIAAAFVGQGYPVSLARLVERFCKYKLPKSLTFTHWDERPLSDVHIEYAANDVRFLLLLRQKLCKKLDEAGHMDWARQEMMRLEEMGNYQFNPKTAYQRIRKSRSMGPRSLTVLRALVAVRDAAAREHDLPPRTLLKDEVLLALSRTPRNSIPELKQVQGLPRPLAEAYGQQLIDATQTALAEPKSSWPSSQEPDLTFEQRATTDHLWALIQAWCLGSGVAPSLVITRATTGQAMLAHRRGEGAASALPKGWRQVFLGQTISDLLDGSHCMKLTWSKKSLRASLAEHHADKID